METFSTLLAICEGNLPVTGWFPSQRPATRNFDVFFYLLLNKRLSKQSRRRWFETPSRPLWRHCYADINHLQKCMPNQLQKHEWSSFNMATQILWDSDRTTIERLIWATYEIWGQFNCNKDDNMMYGDGDSDHERHHIVSPWTFWV